MSDPIRFLNAFAQAIAGIALYTEGHPARERAVDHVYQELLDLQATTPHPLFTFLGDEVVFGRLPLRELKGWDWSARLANAGIQRLEFDAQVTREELEDFLDGVLARLTLRAIDTSEVRQPRLSGIRFGAVGVRGDDQEHNAPLPIATLSFSLGEEAETVRWLHTEVKSGILPLAEAEAVVRSLSVAMHANQAMLLPLLQLKEFDQYTTTHSMNVSVLAMALAEHLGLGPAAVRSIGVAGLLHDVGKVRIPLDILTKPGKLTPAEREVMQQHPADGARVILSSGEHLDLAAVVAYEHHIMLNGEGYPPMRYRRDCHEASRLVHVCDVYDALRTNRPYREAWSPDRVTAYIDERAGTEFDGQVANAFTAMMRQWEAQVAVLTSEAAPLPAAPGPEPQAPAPPPESIPEPAAAALPAAPGPPTGP